MRVNDTISGALIICFAIAMIAVAQQFPGFPGQNYGPALFPTVLGICLIICGGVLVARGIFERRIKGHPWVINDGSNLNVLRFLLVIALVAAYILFSDMTGFIIASMVVLLVLYAAFGVKWYVSVPVALACTIGVQLLFVNLLRVPLPRGWLDPIL